MYLLAVVVTCVSVALAQYEYFPSNNPDGGANAYKDSNSPWNLNDTLEMYRDADEDDDANSISVPAQTPSPDTTIKPDYPTSKKPFPDATYSGEYNGETTKCPDGMRVHPNDIKKFIWGGHVMTCPKGTFFEPSACACQNIYRCPLGPYKDSIYKFVLGGEVMTCPEGTYFDAPNCTCNHIPSQQASKKTKY